MPRPRSMRRAASRRPELNDPSVLTKQNYHFSFSQLKESVGVSVQWLAPLGLFRFSLAVPLNAIRQNDIPGNGPLTWGDETRTLPVLGRTGILGPSGGHSDQPF